MDIKIKMPLFIASCALHKAICLSFLTILVSKGVMFDTTTATTTTQDHSGPLARARWGEANNVEF